MMTRAVTKLKIDRPAEECAEPHTSKLDERFLQAKRSPPTRSLLFYPISTPRFRDCGQDRFRSASSSPLQIILVMWGGLNDCGYRAMPRVKRTLVSYLSPQHGIVSKGSILAFQAVAYDFNAGRQGVRGTMSVLQAYQADLHKELDERETMSSDDITELMRTTDLALRATKETAGAIGQSMSGL